MYVYKFVKTGLKQLAREREGPTMKRKENSVNHFYLFYVCVMYLFMLSVAQVGVRY